MTAKSKFVVDTGADTNQNINIYQSNSSYR